MTDRKTIRLVVEMPDPGEWCVRRGNPPGSGCKYWAVGTGCRLGFPPQYDMMRQQWDRPQACRDAEVTR